MMRQLSIAIIVAISSWYGMMALHEAGHCVGAWLSGGSVEDVAIPLFGFSRTDYGKNPHPLFTTWAGPVGGVLAASILLGVARRLRDDVRHGTLFFGGFSLIANGLYIGLGGFYRAGDCGDLLRYGAHLWQLVTFGMVATGLGMYCWHRMGPLQGWFAGNAPQAGR